MASRARRPAACPCGPPARVHGFPEKYRELCRYLRQAGCTVWLPVLRGHGQGGIVHVDRFEDYVRDMACFLRDIVPERPLLFGHSMGGGVAARLSAGAAGLCCTRRFVLAHALSADGPRAHWLALGCARALLRRGERRKSLLFSALMIPTPNFRAAAARAAPASRAAMDCRAECPAYQTMGASNRWVYESLALRSRSSARAPAAGCRSRSWCAAPGGTRRSACGSSACWPRALPQGRLLEFPDEKHELYNAGNAGLAAFLGAVLEFFRPDGRIRKGRDKMTLLIVVDMQNDFVTGALGTAEAQSDRAACECEDRSGGCRRLYARHPWRGLPCPRREGKRLPVPHCIRGTWGRTLADGLTVRRRQGGSRSRRSAPLPSASCARNRFAAGEIRPRGARRPVHGYLRHFERPAVQGLLPGASCFRGCGLLRGRDAREPPQCALCDAVLSDRRVKYCTRREVTARDETVTGYFFGHFDGGV